MDLECSRKINSISFYAVTRKSAKSSAAVRTSQSFVALSRELASLDETAAAIGAYRAAQKEVDELRELLADASTDEDMRALAKGEIAGAEQKLEEAGEALKLALLPKDAADEKSVILEVRAGTGGDEASLFAGDLFRAYQKYAALKGWSVEIVSASEGALGGYKEIIAEIGGRGVYGRLKFEWACIASSACRRPRRRDASTPPPPPSPCCREVEEVDLVINDKDLQIDTMRSQGAGGQHVNKTEFGDPHHPCPVRHRGDDAGGAIAASQQGEGDGRAALASLRRRTPRSTARARRIGASRWARATAPSASAPIISRKGASPTTALI